MILQRIKEETSQHHQALERSPLLHLFTDKSITKVSYQLILEKFYGFFHPLEQQIMSFPLLNAYLPDLSERRKSKRLVEDLKFLHPERRVSEIPLCDSLPSLRNDTQAFGCLYVLEGSTLGGRIISRILSEKLQLDERFGASYFNGYGAQTGAKWTAFCQAMLSYSQQFHEDETIIETANLTFAKLKTWLET